MIENLKGKDFKKELVLKGILISFAILFYFFIKNIPFALEKIRLFLRICAIFIAFRANLCYPIMCESACS